MFLHIAIAILRKTKIKNKCIKLHGRCEALGVCNLSHTPRFFCFFHKSKEYDKSHLNSFNDIGIWSAAINTPYVCLFVCLFVCLSAHAFPSLLHSQTIKNVS